ncbi:MAG TPA: hypothetical protein VJ841_03555 [Candidatus Saccharimonadales bacterium]|nr:hypothetical protein [Candidatus Saccharimonadales bacterium]
MDGQDPNKDNFKNDGYAHTAWEIPKRDFDFQAHDWIQEGAQIICRGAGHASHASPIDIEKMLIKEEGEYKIVPIRMLS